MLTPVHPRHLRKQIQAAVGIETWQINKVRHSVQAFWEDLEGKELSKFFLKDFQDAWESSCMCASHPVSYWVTWFV